MGIAQIPAASAGLTSAIKSIQRGTAASAGNITIAAVDTAKTICNSFSTSSAGSVAATGVVNAFSGNVGAHSTGGASTSSTTFADTGDNVWTRFGFPVGGRGAFYSPYNGNFDVVNTSRTINAANINAQNVNAAAISVNAMNITGGTTSLTTAVYGVFLVNSTTITATGPCRYEVIEYF